MKNRKTRWFRSRTEGLASDEPRPLSAGRSQPAMDDLERRLTSEADAWAQQYEHTRSQPQPVPLRTPVTEVDSRLRRTLRTRQLISAVMLLAACLVILGGLRFGALSGPQQATGPNRDRQEGVGQDVVRLEVPGPEDVAAQSLIASAHAVDEICSRVLAGVRRRRISLRTPRVADLVESNLAEVAEQLRQPGRQYGRSLAWFERRLQLVSPASVRTSDGAPN